MEIIKTSCYKGTVIRLGNEKRELINRMTETLFRQRFTEISIPIIQFQDTFKGKVGEENNNLMFDFQDRKGRNICLAPEYTAVIQKLAQQDFKYQKGVKLFYIAECFRGERQQYGRWRQFTQIGVEWLHPKDMQETRQELIDLATDLVDLKVSEYHVDESAKRGLDYYKGDGFEIRSRAGLQLCGGGEYEEGYGFAIGVDRLFV